MVIKNNFKTLQRLRIKRNNKMSKGPAIYLKPSHHTAIFMRNILKKISILKQGPSLVEGGNSISQSYFYFYNNSKKYLYIKLINNANQILNYFFGTFYALIGRPVYLFTQNKLIIFINCYMPKTSKRLSTRYIWKYNKARIRKIRRLKLELKTLVLKLSKLFNLNVELQLNKIKYPYQDSNILAKVIALGSNMNRFRNIMNLILKRAFVITKTLKQNNRNPKNTKWKKAVGDWFKDFYSVIINRRRISIHKTVPAILTGIKVRVSGRLSRDRVIPKKTVSQRESGSFIRNKNSFVDYAVYNSKNKRGAYSIKVWTTSKLVK